MSVWLSHLTVIIMCLLSVAGMCLLQSFITQMFLSSLWCQGKEGENTKSNSGESVLKLGVWSGYLGSQWVTCEEYKQIPTVSLSNSNFVTDIKEYAAAVATITWWSRGESIMNCSIVLLYYYFCTAHVHVNQPQTASWFSGTSQEIRYKQINIWAIRIIISGEAARMR